MEEEDCKNLFNVRLLMKSLAGGITLQSGQPGGQERYIIERTRIQLFPPENTAFPPLTFGKIYMKMMAGVKFNPPFSGVYLRKEKMSNRTLFLTDELYRYMRAFSLREPEILQRLREETSHDPMAEMQISPEQGQFMSLLVRLMGAKRALEVGVYTGYSSLCVALSLPPGGKLIACDISKQWTDVARRYWREGGVEEIVDLRLAPAIETMEHLLAHHEAGRFDFIFIDADKGNYDGYYERALSLLRAGGLMAIDNVFWSGRVADSRERGKDTTAIRALNERIHNDQRVELSLIPIGDGLTLARKRP
jgi:predicted O-methyltransferase YrrM